MLGLGFGFGFGLRLGLALGVRVKVRVRFRNILDWNNRRWIFLDRNKRGKKSRGPAQASALLCGEEGDREATNPSSENSDTNRLCGRVRARFSSAKTQR